VPKGVTRPVAAGSSTASERVSARPVYFGEQHGWLETGIYRHSALAPGVPLEGPAVVEEMSATSVVLPGQHASVDRAGNIIIES